MATEATVSAEVSAAPTERGAAAVGTTLLILAQLVVWVVVNRYLMSGESWTTFALRPGTPSELQLLVAPFVHIEAAHLGINLAVLWLLGANLERAIGTPRFMLLYLGSAWFASLMQWATATAFNLQPDLSARYAAVGSSGAIAGILAAALVRFPVPWLHLPFASRVCVPLAPVLLCWLGFTAIRALLTTMHGIHDGIGHWAHLGGFVFGLAAAQALGLHRDGRQDYLAQSALAASRRGDLPDAARAWSSLLAMRPSDVGVRAALIAARLALGDEPGARRLARDGIRDLVRSGERDAALLAYLRFLELLPDLVLAPGVRYRIGCWLADEGEAELAYRTLWESVREDGASPAAASALFRAGQLALERMRSPLQAREAWERLLDRFPDSAWSNPARDALARLP